MSGAQKERSLLHETDIFGCVGLTGPDYRINLAACVSAGRSAARLPAGLPRSPPGRERLCARRVLLAVDIEYADLSDERRMGSRW